MESSPAAALSSLPNMIVAVGALGTIYAIDGASLPGHNGSANSVQLLRFINK